MIKDLSDNHLFNNYPCESEDVKIEHLRQQLAAMTEYANKRNTVALDAESQIVQLRDQVTLLRDVMNRIAFSRVGKCESIAKELFNREMWAAEALAATEPKP